MCGICFVGVRCIILGQRRENSGREELSRGNVHLTALCVVRYYVIWSGVCTAGGMDKIAREVVGFPHIPGYVYMGSSVKYVAETVWGEHDLRLVLYNCKTIM